METNLKCSPNCSLWPLIVCSSPFPTVEVFCYHDVTVSPPTISSLKVNILLLPDLLLWFLSATQSFFMNISADLHSASRRWTETENHEVWEIYWRCFAAGLCGNIWYMSEVKPSRTTCMMHFKHPAVSHMILMRTSLTVLVFCLVTLKVWVVLCSIPVVTERNKSISTCWSELFPLFLHLLHPVFHL